jgi:hypothetical protein
MIKRNVRVLGLFHRKRSLVFVVFEDGVVLTLDCGNNAGVEKRVKLKMPFSRATHA